MARKPRVVIVEDDPDALLRMRMNLEIVGFETSLAADGGTAIRRILAEKPDVVVLDLMLPVLDGWAVLAELGSGRSGPPVVVCSARTTHRDRRRAREMGAAAFVAKPFEMEELLDALRSVLITRTGEGWDLSLDALFGRHTPGTAPA